MGSAMGAGRGADMLQDILRQKFAETITRQRMQLEERRQQEQSEYQRESLDSLKESRADAANARSQAGAMRVASTTAPGSELDDTSASTLESGGLGGLIRRTDATLGSRNLSGIADSGATPRISRILSTDNPGQGPKTIYQGAAQQQHRQRQQDALQRLSATSTDPRLRQFLDAQEAGVTLPSELLKENKPQTRPVMRVNPRTGKMEQLGDAPAGAHFVQEPPPQQPRAPKEPKDTSSLALRLADDYARDSKDYATMNSAMRRVVASAKDPSAAGDMSLLYSYMKILDPGSVVRETEFATAAQSGSLPQQVQAAASKVLSGQRLTPDQRADFVKRARGLYGEASSSNKSLREGYTQRSKKFGVDPSLVFTELGEPGGDAPPADAAARAAALISKYGGG